MDKMKIESELSAFTAANSERNVDSTYLPAAITSSIAASTKSSSGLKLNSQNTQDESDLNNFKHRQIIWVNSIDEWEQINEDVSKRFTPITLPDLSEFIDISAPAGLISSNDTRMYDPLHRIDVFIEKLDSDQIKSILRSNPFTSNDIQANTVLLYAKPKLASSLSRDITPNQQYRLVPELAKSTYEDSLAFASSYQNFFPAGTTIKRSSSSYILDWLESLANVSFRVPTPSMDFWSLSDADSGSSLTSALMSEIIGFLSGYIEEMSRDIGSVNSSKLSHPEIVSELSAALEKRYDAEVAANRTIDSDATREAYINRPVLAIQSLLSSFAGVTSLQVPTTSLVMQIQALRTALDFMLTMKQGLGDINTSSNRTVDASSFSITTLIEITKKYMQFKDMQMTNTASRDILAIHNFLFSLATEYPAIGFLMNMAEACRLPRMGSVAISYANMENFLTSFNVGKKSLYGFAYDKGYESVPLLGVLAGYSPAGISLSTDSTNDCFSDATVQKRAEYLKAITEATGINATDLHSLAEAITNVADGKDSSDHINRNPGYMEGSNHAELSDYDKVNNPFKKMTNPFASELAESVNSKNVELIEEYLSWEKSLSENLKASRGYTSLTAFVDHWLELATQLTGVAVDAKTEAEIYLRSVNSINGSVPFSLLLVLGENMQDFRMKLAERSNKIVVHSSKIKNVSETAKVPEAEIMTYIVARLVDSITASSVTTNPRIPVLLNTVSLADKSSNANVESWGTSVKIGNALDDIAAAVGSYYSTIEQAIANWPSDVFSPDMTFTEVGEQAAVTVLKNYVEVMSSQIISTYNTFNKGVRPTSLPSNYIADFFKDMSSANLIKGRSVSIFSDKVLDGNTQVLSYVEDSKKTYSGLLNGEINTLAAPLDPNASRSSSAFKMMAMDTLSVGGAKSYLQSLMTVGSDETSAVNTINPSKSREAVPLQLFFHETETPVGRNGFQDLFPGRAAIAMSAILQTGYFRALSSFFDVKRISSFSQLVSSNVISEAQSRAFFLYTKHKSEDATMTVNSMESQYRGSIAFLQAATLAFERKKVIVLAIPKFNRMGLLSFNFEDDDFIRTRVNPEYFSSFEVFPPRMILANMIPLTTTYSNNNFVGIVIRAVSRAMDLLGQSNPGAFGFTNANVITEAESKASVIFDMRKATEQLKKSSDLIDELISGQTTTQLAKGIQSVINALSSTDKGVSEQAMISLLDSMSTSTLANLVSSSEQMFKKKKPESASAKGAPRTTFIAEAVVGEQVELANKKTNERKQVRRDKGFPEQPEDAKFDEDKKGLDAINKKKAGNGNGNGQTGNNKTGLNKPGFNQNSRKNK